MRRYTKPNRTTLAASLAASLLLSVTITASGNVAIGNLVPTPTESVAGVRDHWKTLQESGEKKAKSCGGWNPVCKAKKWAGEARKHGEKSDEIGSAWEDADGTGDRVHRGESRDMRTALADEASILFPDTRGRRRRRS